MNLRSAVYTVFVLALFAPGFASAAITFRQLDDDIFVVSHRVKIIGSRGKAMDMAITKTSSLCVAAGYTHFEILQENSEASQSDDTANASIRAQFFLADGSGRIECDRGAEQDYVDEAAEKLRKSGYQPPDPSTAAPAASSSSETSVGGLNCTLEQIAAMARTGLADDQIRAACQ